MVGVSLMLVCSGATAAQLTKATASDSPAADVSSVQSGSASIANGSSLAVRLPAAARQGDLLAVYVEWDGDTSASVSDNRGNDWSDAGSGVTTWGSGGSSQVLYAGNVAAGATTVSVQLGTSSAASLYVHEYAGLASTDPVDRASANTGNGVRLASKSIGTSQDGDLVFAAGSGDAPISSAGLGYSVQAMHAGDIVEDQTAETAGRYRPTAWMSDPGDWVMSVVAFKAASSGESGSSGGPGAPGSSSSASAGPTSAAPSESPSSTTTAPTSSTPSSASSTPTSTKPTSSQPASSQPASTSAGQPSSGGSSGDCDHPSPDCTGLPDGTKFANTVNGDYTVTTSGQVIDSWHITGSLIIAASNVTVRKSEIDGTVDNEVGSTHYTPFSIADSTVGPASGCIVAPGVGEDGYTAENVLIRGHDDGFRMSGSNIKISDSYAHLCFVSASADPPDGSHSDGIQTYCPDRACSGLIFADNVIDARGIPATSAINLTDPNFSDATITGNVLMGGGYTFYSVWHGGPDWTVTDNQIVAGTWDYAAVTADNTCSHQKWSGNSLVTIASDYDLLSVVSPLPCIQ